MLDVLVIMVGAGVRMRHRVPVTQAVHGATRGSCGAGSKQGPAREAGRRMPGGTVLGSRPSGVVKRS